MPAKPSRKKPVNLSIDPELVSLAKEAGTNMSALLEKALREELSEQRYKAWRDENREALQASNAELAEHGMWYTPGWLGK